MKVQIFSDFDGTITNRDTGTVIVDHFITEKRRRDLDLSVLNNTKTFRDAG